MALQLEPSTVIGDKIRNVLNCPCDRKVLMLPIQRKFRYVLVGAVLAILLLAACKTSPEAETSSIVVQSEPQAAPAAQSQAVDAPESPQIVPLDEPLEAPAGVPEELAVVWEVWKLLTSEHVERSNLEPEAFTEAAIRGMLQALGDPHTNYVRPEAFSIENEDLLGRFEGIGANVSMRADGRLVIVAPIEGSPADKAGIRPGDVILEVDDEDILGLSLLEAVNKIRGPRGTKVKLLVMHIAEIDSVIIVVERGIIPLESVLLRSEPGDRLAHIRITNFFTDTADKLSKTINEVAEGGAEGILIDVRDNPGGLLSSVVDVTSLFIDDGLVLYEVDGEGRRTNWEVRRKDGVARKIPVVILANEFSASASEILVGALQDHDRATFVGAQTFGKGSVNILRGLGNGGGLFLTFAHWFTPSGRLIQGNGLAPDIEIVARDAREADTMQLEKAREVLLAEVNALAAGRSGL
ncbi:MAG: S41 family peptidase [Chloroflexi bacterium]|nr:S41 family peptidase [Chloroflexota bacterium]